MAAERSWERIAAVGGTMVGGSGILIQYEKRPARGRLGFAVPTALMTTPALGRAEFDALIRVLGDRLVPAHGHVKLNPVRRDEP